MNFDDYRYEVKFGAPARDEPALRAQLRLHRAALRLHHPPRIVNSLYFDTAEFEGVLENLAGVSERSKIRLRWYGDDLGVVDGRMERKEKRNALGRKITCDLDPPLVLRGRSWKTIMADLCSRDLGPLNPDLTARPVPALIVRYRREYFTTADGRVRVTFDSELTSFDQSRRNEPNLERGTIGEAPIVVEVKGAYADRDAVAAVAAGLPLRRIAYSKYANGVLATAA